MASRSGCLTTAEVTIQASEDRDRQCLDRRLDSQALIARGADVEQKRNDRQARLQWTFTLAAARQKLRKLYPSIEG
jgi:hypothetical protein